MSTHGHELSDTTEEVLHIVRSNLDSCGDEEIWPCFSLSNAREIAEDLDELQATIKRLESDVEWYRLIAHGLAAAQSSDIMPPRIERCEGEWTFFRNGIKEGRCCGAPGPSCGNLPDLTPEALEMLRAAYPPPGAPDTDAEEVVQ